MVMQIAQIKQLLFKPYSAEALEKLRLILKDLAETGTLNATVSKEQAAQAESLQKSIRRLGLEFDLFTKSIVGSAIPALLEFFKTLNAIIQPYAILGNNLEELEGALSKVNATIEKNNSLGKEKL